MALTVCSFNIFDLFLDERRFSFVTDIVFLG